MIANLIFSSKYANTVMMMMKKKKEFFMMIKTAYKIIFRIIEEAHLGNEVKTFEKKILICKKLCISNYEYMQDKHAFRHIFGMRWQTNYESA